MGNVSALNQRSVLSEDREERCAADFFPKIVTGLVPILSDIVEVVADDGPDDLLGSLGVTVFDQVVDVLHEGDGS